MRKLEPRKTMIDPQSQGKLKGQKY
jgi:hypothetical protein